MPTDQEILQATLSLPHFVIRPGNTEACYRFDPEERQLIQIVRSIAFFIQKEPDESALYAIFGDLYSQTAGKCIKVRNDAESGMNVFAVVVPHFEIPLDDRL